MQKVIKLNKKGCKRLEQIKKDLRAGGKSPLCPNWNKYTSGYSVDCTFCGKLFPKTKNNTLCPCNAYSSSYLIKRLNQIIKYNKENNYKSE